MLIQASDSKIQLLIFSHPQVSHSKSFRTFYLSRSVFINISSGENLLKRRF